MPNFQQLFLLTLTLLCAVAVWHLCSFFAARQNLNAKSLIPPSIAHTIQKGAFFVKILLLI
ncbi:MAG: hypothetical protein IKD11_03740, partial [Oscillospiraceae bacterium]|nr:hypothetical protein [Oscillospiraceae bacterium]